MSEISGSHNTTRKFGRRHMLGMATAAVAMPMLGATRNDFAEVHELTLAEQYRELSANELDAFVYEVPHPNGLIQDVVRR